MPYKNRKTRNRKQYERRRSSGYFLTPKWRYLQYKRDASSRGYSFKISFEEFSELCGKECYYCGITVSVGIDRVDNADGYVAENLVTCCAACNVAKNKFTRDEFIDRCKKIASRH